MGSKSGEGTMMKRRSRREGKGKDNDGIGDGKEWERRGWEGKGKRG